MAETTIITIPARLVLAFNAGYCGDAVSVKLVRIEGPNGAVDTLEELAAPPADEGPVLQLVRAALKTPLGRMVHKHAEDIRRVYEANEYELGSWHELGATPDEVRQRFEQLKRELATANEALEYARTSHEETLAEWQQRVADSERERASEQTALENAQGIANAWRLAIEEALGLEGDVENHTPAWAMEVVRELRELGNQQKPRPSALRMRPVVLEAALGTEPLQLTDDEAEAAMKSGGFCRAHNGEISRFVKGHFEAWSVECETWVRYPAKYNRGAGPWTMVENPERAEAGNG